MPQKKPPVLIRIPPNTRESRCRSCKARVWWVPSPKDPDRNVIVSTHDADGNLVEGCRLPLVTAEGYGVSHFATCPDAAKWRRTPQDPTKTAR